MDALLALLPILLVLFLMVVLRWSSPLAGAAGWVCGLVVAFLAFGLNGQVLWVSQVKGLLLTLNVVFTLWPGIFIYHLVDQLGGIRAISAALEGMVHERGWLLVLQAWMLSAIIESLAGFGLPIAMVAPLMIQLGVAPILAVAAAAVGHAWASSTGGMALSLRLLSDITHYPGGDLFPPSALLLGVSIVLSGLAVALLLKEQKHWWRVLIAGGIAAGVHALAGVVGLTTVSALVASVAGFMAGTLLNHSQLEERMEAEDRPALKAGLIAYGILVVMILVVALVPPISRLTGQFAWTLYFPSVSTRAGFSTPAEGGYLFHFLSHPGTLILVSVALALLVFRLDRAIPRPDLKLTLKRTVRSGLPASVGTLFMIGLSTTMEHTGMTSTLATSLSSLAGGVYPLFAPLIGVLGSFATGSNVSSNVLFGVLQEKVAVLVGASPVAILAAQTTGGSLGSSIAPAKLALGTSTSDARGQEGEVLRITLPISMAIAILVGLVTLLIS